MGNFYKISVGFIPFWLRSLPFILTLTFQNSFKSESVRPCDGSKLLKLDVVHASVQSVIFFYKDNLD